MPNVDMLPWARSRLAILQKAVFAASGATMSTSIPGPPTIPPSAGRPPTARPRVQVVVAHPDDETFGCGSWLLHAAAAAGAVTAVCCATRGEAGEPPRGRTWQPSELAAVRERELREASALLGVERVDLLHFLDS